MAYGRENGSSLRQGTLADSFLPSPPRVNRPESLGPVDLAEGADIVSRAASILAREGAALPSSLPGIAGGLPSPLGTPSAIGAGLPDSVGLHEPQVTAHVERLRRQAHDLLETLLTSFSPKGSGPEERVPLLWCAAPASPGGEGTVTLRVTNDEAEPLEVTLYSSNFVSDGGGDIPSMRVTVSPRRIVVGPKADVAFELKISVPQQAPAGVYSGLVQATGARYVKAVVCLDVK
jgi:hypothetical protein